MATCQKLEEFTKGAVIPCTLFFNTFLEHLLEPCYGAEEDFWSNSSAVFINGVKSYDLYKVLKKIW